jgi:hypothetical protein
MDSSAVPSPTTLQCCVLLGVASILTRTRL